MVQSGSVDSTYSGDISDDLETAFTQVMEEQERLSLLKSLLNKGACTRDILSFITSQADARNVNKDLDEVISRKAMKSKVEDSKKVLEQKKCRKTMTIKQCLKRIGNRGFKLRKTITKIKSKLAENRKNKQMKNEKKIAHLQKKIEQLRVKYKTNKGFNPTKVPDRLSEFSDLSIFKTPRDLPAKQVPVGPFLCSPHIKLDDNEKKLLSRDPNYSINKHCDMLTFNMELERGLGKHRYNEHGKKTEKKKLHNIITLDPGDNDDRTRVVTGNKDDAKNDDRMEKLRQIWKKEAHRHTFDPFNNTVSFSQRRPTDYKLNTRVILPKALDCDEEFACEIRKRAYLEAFTEYDQKVKKMKKEKKENTCDTEKINKGELQRITNLSKKEQAALKSIKSRIKSNELMVVSTDKSSRFGVMTYEQYLEAGRSHTSKDREITWDEVRYMKNQTNSHMWWLSKIWAYSKGTDEDRMLKNLTVAGLDLPEMSLLVKDHKSWSFESGKPVPTRPVLSGNCAINTHLSELISEIIEPVALQYNGAEVQSSEEMLAQIDMINVHVSEHKNIPTWNVLDKFIEANTEMRGPISQRIECGNENISVQSTCASADRTENEKNEHENLLDSNIFNVVSGHEYSKEREEEAVGNKVDLNLKPRAQVTGTGLDHGSASFMTDGMKLECDSVTDDLVNYSTDSEDDHDDIVETLTELGLESLESKKKSFKEKITDFFTQKTGNKTEHQVDDHKWLSLVSGTYKKKFVDGKGTLNDKLSEGIKAGDYWARAQSTKFDRIKDGQCNQDLQDTGAKPIMVGCDVVGLYPNLDPICVAELTAQAVRKSNVKFSAINYSFLIIYLVLTLGSDQMQRLGLGKVIPKNKGKEKIRSLAASQNRNLENWDFENVKLDDTVRRNLVALMLHVMVLLLTSTTCYRFGGKIYKQTDGLGIGLRASAAIARLVMVTWDQTWGALQRRLGLVVLLFCRYVDDVRVYLKPIAKGWRWTDAGWTFSAQDDIRTPYERTLEELNKSLDFVWSFMKFTTEGENDFNDAFLPTLDFATHVTDEGYIKYRFFSKPMASNMVLQFGTALSKNCTFSSLRQDLVRRFLNSDRTMGTEYRLQLVENYIQLLVNSDHKFAYIKAVVLQAITKYLYMQSRDSLPQDHKRYCPMHRLRSYKSQERKLMKYAVGVSWYTDDDFKDKYRNQWKNWIRRKGDTNNKTGPWGKKNLKPGCGKGIHNKQEMLTTTAMFIPNTVGGELIKRVEEQEVKIQSVTGWKAKVVEKPGTPLITLFQRSFDMAGGCARVDKCMCEGKGTSCMVKGVVYTATCQLCNSVSKHSVYVGETARQLGTRVSEHLDNIEKFKKESFILEHWMDEHATEGAPPQFSFKLASKHNDPLSRQLMEAVSIRDKGNLNRRNEFSLNEIVKLQPSVNVWDEAVMDRQNKKSLADREQKINCFTSVMLNVVNLQKEKVTTMCNNVINYRHSKKRKAVMEQDGAYKRSRPAMTSTPVSHRERRLDPVSYREQILDSDESSESVTVEGNVSLTLTSGSSCGEAGHSKTDLSGGAGKITIDPEKPPETSIENLAAHTVTMESFQDATNCYSRRENVCELVGNEIIKEWGSGDKFKANKSDSHSFEQSVLLEDQVDDLGLTLLFSESSVHHTNGTTGDEIDYGLDWLFGCENNYYQEVECEEVLVEQLVKEKIKNKLYSIFLKEPTMKPTSTIKRKLSPQEETINKMRRMTIETHSSPAVRTPRRKLKLNRTLGTRSLSRSGTSDKSKFKQVLITEVLKASNSGKEDDQRS